MATKRKRKHLIQTLVSDEMLEQLKREAERRDVSMSHLLREVIALWSVARRHDPT